jgi:hypothetical protein
LANKTGPTRLDFAILLKFFQYAARFPLSMQEEVPATAVAQKKGCHSCSRFAGPGNRNHWSGWDLGIEPTAGRITQCGDRRWRNSGAGAQISREIETLLADEARRQGISVDALLEQLINERAALTPPAQCNPELPVWHLGGVGALHRRDIYDDAR